MAAAAHWGPVTRAGMSVSITLVQNENIREKMYQACPPGNQDPESMLKLIPAACFTAQATNAHWTSCRLSLATGLLKQMAWKTLHIWLASFEVLSWMSWPKSWGHINHRNETTETKTKKVSSRDLSLQLCFFLYLCHICLFLFLSVSLSLISFSLYISLSSEISQHEKGMMIQIILFWCL